MGTRALVSASPHYAGERRQEAPIPRPPCRFSTSMGVPQTPRAHSIRSSQADVRPALRNRGSLVDRMAPTVYSCVQQVSPMPVSHLAQRPLPLICSLLGAIDDQRIEDVVQGCREQIRRLHKRSSLSTLGCAYIVFQRWEGSLMPLFPCRLVENYCIVASSGTIAYIYSMR